MMVKKSKATSKHMMPEMHKQMEPIMKGKKTMNSKGSMKKGKMK